MYYAKVTTRWGIGLFAGTNLRDIASEVIAEEGSDSVWGADWATQEDVDWIAAMGGVVPEGAKVKPSALPA